MSIIQARLKERREATGLSQGQVAEYEGISTSYLSGLERGYNAPAVWPLLARLARRYRTNTDYLLGLTDDPRPMETAESVTVVKEAWVAYEVVSADVRSQVQKVVDLFLTLGEEDRRFVMEMLALVEQRNQPRIIGDE